MYISNNNIHFNESDLTTLDLIPVGNWLLCQDPNSGEYYLKSKPSYELPDLIYGSTYVDCEKYLNTFKNRNKNMGVLLSGMKGTGKSLLAKMLCINSNIPVIIITDTYTGTGFIDFFSKINQSVVIFIDEFEKLYNKSEDQSGLLSLLDGSFPSKFLFILTINEINRMNSYMINRPGRIHYLKEYDGLSEDVINDIVNNLLINIEHKKDIIEICNYLGEISMDMITSLIEECNLYPTENPRVLLRELNIKPENGLWDVKVFKDSAIIHETFRYYSPLNSNVLEIDFTTKSDEVYFEIEWELSECDIQITGLDTLIKRKIEMPDLDESNNGISIKFTKNKKSNYVF